MPAKSVDELVALAKASPGKLNYAAVVGASPHFMGELFKRARGIDIPGEMSFVGFSDSPAFRWWGAGLTTIGLPVREIALACSAFLLRRAGLQQPASALPYQAMHAPTLIVRGSTAPPQTRPAPAARRRAHG